MKVNIFVSWFGLLGGRNIFVMLTPLRISVIINIVKFPPNCQLPFVVERKPGLGFALENRQIIPTWDGNRLF